jgi:cytochrome c-type biogenesis protein CcmH/NrfF
MPAWLVWLLPVPVATLAAVAWTAWAGRTRRPVAAVDSVLAYEKFRQALNAPVPAPRTETPGQQKAGSGS